MSDTFYERPILNSPYEYPARHWELDRDRLPTNTIVERRRRAEFLTPIPRPKRRSAKQKEIVFD
jgi:type III restriction enzyme